MEKQKQIRKKITERIFTYLVRMAIKPDFSFPKGGLANKAISTCITDLEKQNGSLSTERLIDYCICQVYTISRFDEDYLNHKWKASHSFGSKAIERFTNTKVSTRYYEDKWLRTVSLSREGLALSFGDKSKHPLHVFIFPEYEEITKRRMHNSEVGYYICQIATLLWTPFSPLCQKCKNQIRCKDITQHKYTELYRIRVKEYTKADKK